MERASNSCITVAAYVLLKLRENKHVIYKGHRLLYCEPGPPAVCTHALISTDFIRSRTPTARPAVKPAHGAADSARIERRALLALVRGRRVVLLRDLGRHLGPVVKVRTMRNRRAALVHAGVLDCARRERRNVRRAEYWQATGICGERARVLSPFRCASIASGVTIVAVREPMPMQPR